ncbi:MAG: CHAT domain-containing protein [Acidobacteriota bacterium]
MARLPQGLSVALALWLVLSRTSTASRTGSPNSSHWWGTEDYTRVKHSAEQLRRTGDYPALEKLYGQALQQARIANHPLAQVSYLTALGNTYVFLFRYTDALNAYREARQVAESMGDWLAAGAVAPGLSSVYFLVGDSTAALGAIEEGMAAAHRSGVHPYYEAQLTLQYARLSTGSTQTAQTILRAIEAARTLDAEHPLDNVGLEAEGWDLLGEERLLHSDLVGADNALSEAYRLRVLRHPADLRFSYWRLGALRLAQGRLTEAEHLTALAITANQEAGADLSRGTLLHQRGLIRQARGETRPALEDFAAAAESADEWRLAVPPASQATLAAANAALEEQVFRTFVEAAAHEALAQGREEWIRQSFLASEMNRAASLRQSKDLAEAWHRKLPAQYWTALSRLRMVEMQSLREGPVKARTGYRRPEVEKLQLELASYEAGAGLGALPNKIENFLRPSSLIHIQQGLAESELLLSFHTGKGESYLWAVTGKSLHLYRLPAAEQIQRSVDEFRSAIAGHAATVQQGEDLYKMLFGKLDIREASKPSWLLSLDDALFDLPFPALRPDPEHFLIERHSLQITPGAFSLAHSSTVPTGGFVGVADAVYNAADARMAPSRSQQVPSSRLQLNRLPASAEEVERSSQIWKRRTPSPPRETHVLEGPGATRKAFVDTLSQAKPATIHLATHVVADTGNPELAYLAFAVDAKGDPELLGTAEIAMLNVSGAMVVMTGCASGVGRELPGAGLLGLTRAWLAAGAQAVISTGWPVEDASGDLLPSFYTHLFSNSTSLTLTAAEALRRGQADMIHSGTWQADPAYWAAFQITGGVR